MKEKNQTRLAILLFGLIFVIIVTGLYLGGKKGEIKSEEVKKGGVKVENTYRGDDSRAEKSGESSPREKSGDSPYEGRLRDDSYEEELVLEGLPEDVFQSEEKELRYNFYGEKLVFISAPEDAFKIVIDQGEFYVVRYKKAGEEKTDSSIYSYAIFDPALPNRLSIDLYNISYSPVEMDYDGDRYYVQDYAGNTYQLKIDMKRRIYNEGISVEEGKTILVEYPSPLSEANVKNIVVRLKKGGIVVGLQRLPDILY